MKKVLIIGLLYISATSVGQTDTFFKISGFVKDDTTQRVIGDSRVTLFSDHGEIIETSTDTLGFFSFDSLKTYCINYEIKIEAKYYFGKKGKIKFNRIPHDTLINYGLTEIPVSIDWFPEIYFNYNTSTPQDSFELALNVMYNWIKDDSNINLIITGIKDSLETKDRRQERAEFVYNELIKLGIDKKRLSIEIINKPNILKFVPYRRNKITGEIDFIELNEKYILNSPIEVQSSLRRRNQCVEFRIK